jgi:two-component system, sensor histidine kinase PdtaS
VLVDRIRRVSGLSSIEAEHLRLLCSSWQLLADLSFSDLLLYVRSASDDAFEVSAQLRPFTSQTLYPADLVGTRVTQPEQPIVERAFREGLVWEQEDPVVVNNVPIRMEAVPVRCAERVIGVITKEGSPATSRRPGRLEQIYLEAAEKVSRMICEGSFPRPDTPAGEWPRVGDGLFALDNSGCVEWASPNALSALRRLGVQRNAQGDRLDDLGLGETPVSAAVTTGKVVDGELVRGETHVRLRVVPLLLEGAAAGALCLARDVSEVRQKERVISVKDAAIREIHHRVKNNLQTIASLLRLQARRLSSVEAKEVLAESVLRIGSIALVHETLSEEPSDQVEFGEVARRIATMVQNGLLMPDAEIEISVTGRPGALGASLATPLAVTLTELLQNAVEHAFVGRSAGRVSVDLSRRGDEIVMVVSDDGVGMDTAALNGARLGLHIVRSLVSELGGSFDLHSEEGVRAAVAVPARE